MQHQQRKIVSFKDTKRQAPYQRFPIEHLVRMDQENGTETTNIISRTLLLLYRYPDFGLFCHPEGSDVRRNRRPLILDCDSVSFVVRPARRRVLTRLRRCASAARFESERFESERCPRQQHLSGRFGAFMAAYSGPR